MTTPDPVTLAAEFARAVESLTAELAAYRKENTRLRRRVARVEALADQLDAEADEVANTDGSTAAETVEARTADRIRTALNGDNA